MKLTLTPSCPLRLAYLTVVVVWAGIYLPALGTLELKGEEGRRAMPGIKMLQTGNWLVPEVGGEDYFRKPPLVNWAVATSVTLTGTRSEWSVRLPSVLAVLALGLGILHWGRQLLGLNGSLSAALIAMTNISMMEKGRLIEIEAIYIALTGLATIAWLHYYQLRKAGIGWLVAGIILGLAMLAKGPVHLLYFYAVVVACAYARSGRGGIRSELLNWRHWLGIAIAVAIFLSWSIPMTHSISETGLGESEATGTWIQQLSARLGFEGFNFWRWWENIFRSAIINFLPWSVLLPMLWHKPLSASMQPDRRRLFFALRNALVLAWLLVAILPGSVPRYTLPLIPLAALVTAMALVEWSKVQSPKNMLHAWRISNVAIAFICLAGGLTAPFIAGFSLRVIICGMLAACAAACAIMLANRLRQTLSQLLISSLLMICFTLIFATAIAPRIQQQDQLAAMANEVQQQLPENATLYFFRPDYQLLNFYLPPTLKITNSGGELEDLPAIFLLVRERHLEQVRARRGWANPETLLEIKDLNDKPLFLLQKQDAN